MKDERQANGRFAVGNPGGPGRPRRAVEREYLAVLSDAVSLDDWREIVQGAVAAAKQGDVKARDWLAQYLLGTNPLTLTELAAAEADGLEAEQDILKALVKRQKDRDWEESYNSSELKKARKTLERAYGKKDNPLVPKSAVN